MLHSNLAGKYCCGCTSVFTFGVGVRAPRTVDSSRRLDGFDGGDGLDGDGLDGGLDEGFPEGVWADLEDGLADLEDGLEDLEDGLEDMFPALDRRIALFFLVSSFLVWFLLVKGGHFN